MDPAADMSKGITNCDQKLFWMIFDYQYTCMSLDAASSWHQDKFQLRYRGVRPALFLQVVESIMYTTLTYIAFSPRSVCDYICDKQIVKQDFALTPIATDDICTVSSYELACL